MTRAILLAALFIAAQAPQAPRFRSSVDAVRVDALVTDGNRPVTGLTAADFELSDSGVGQVVESVSVDEVPISMMIVLDTSTSVQGATLDRLKEAALAAVGALKPDDRTALVLCSSELRLASGWSADRTGITAAISSAKAGGGTSIYDATFTALTLRDDQPGIRSLVVVFSDGADTSSWLPAEAVLEKGRRTDAVVYAVVLGPDASGIRGEGKLMFRSGVLLSAPRVRSLLNGTPMLEELTELTGGDRFATERTGELRAAFTRVVTEFRSRYLLTYTPRGVDAAGWHPLEVKLKDRKGKVKARRGYSK